jgi:hypothetical protein
MNTANALTIDSGDRRALKALALLAWLTSGAGAVIIAIRVVAWFTTVTPTFPLGADVVASGPGAGSTRYTLAEVTHRLSLGTRALFATTDALAIAVVVAIVAAGCLFWTTGRRARFGRTLTVASAVAGPALVLGALLQGAAAFAASAAASSELASDRLSASASFNIGQLITGLAVTALAYLFSRGERLERDTEGLV